MIENYEIRKKARESLKGKWNIPVIAHLILFAVAISPGLFHPALQLILNLLFTGAFSFGMVALFLLLVRKKKHAVKNIFDGFRILERTIPLSLWMCLFILLWALLLIIPGIIAAFRYSMSYYILYDNPKIKAKDAIRKSKEMMLGYKWKLFCLHFSFIGWYLLGILTLGIGWLWVATYQGAATAIFYEELKKEKSTKKKA
jgi:uncharacterized membrane protein